MPCPPLKITYMYLLYFIKLLFKDRSHIVLVHYMRAWALELKFCRAVSYTCADLSAEWTET